MFKHLFLNDSKEPFKPPSQELEAAANSFHQNIVYEKSVVENRKPGSVPSIRTITSLDHIHPVGTVCTASFQRFQENGAEQIFLIMKGVQRIQLVTRPAAMAGERFILHSKALPIRDHA
jgi:hypothetical protein